MVMPHTGIIRYPNLWKTTKLEEARIIPGFSKFILLAAKERH